MSAIRLKLMKNANFDGCIINLSVVSRQSSVVELSCGFELDDGLGQGATNNGYWVSW